MAIAPLGQELPERRQARAGRPPLRVLEGGGAQRRQGPPRHARREEPVRPWIPGGNEAVAASRASHPAARAQARATVASARVRARRDQPAPRTVGRAKLVAAAGVGLAAVVLLALPLRSLAAVTVDGRATPGATVAGLQPGSTYVVQTGDTVASVAAKVTGAPVSLIEQGLRQELGGGSTLVPGEHLVIP